MRTEQIIEQVEEYQRTGKRIFVSSSFQTHSIPLLHILSRAAVELDVLFINTGFHFPETLTFRDEVASLLGLQLVDVTPQVPKVQQKDRYGQFFFVSDPDYCCHLNKVQPLDPYLRQYDVWISGVRADQSQVRKAMQVEEEAPHDTLRFHPMLDWTSKDIYQYRQAHALPEHPLDSKGYLSIGCAPCSRRFDATDERSARWFGMNKSECGLHTELIKTNS